MNATLDTDTITCSSVESPLCDAPANLDLAARADVELQTCDRCAQRSCGPCSVITNWEGNPLAQLCLTCLLDLDRGEEYAQVLWQQAGYSGPAPQRVLHLYVD